LNIGCATQGAAHKRMALALLASHIKALQQQTPIDLVLTGAADESAINEDFIAALKTLNAVPQVCVNLAGRTNIQTLPALIDACDVFVSTDSGPYHMAVALRKPTLCWLTYPELTSFHRHAWVRCLVNPNESTFLLALQELQTQLSERSPIRT